MTEMDDGHAHGQVEDPDYGDALIFAGVLCHFVASDPRLAELMARWMEHCPGDLSAAIITDYASKCHDLLQPECGAPATVDPFAERLT